MEFSDSNIKKFLIFYQKKAFLIFQETELSYISGGTSKAPKTKISYISKKVNNKFF